MASHSKDPQDGKAPKVEDLPPAEEELTPENAEGVQGGATLDATIKGYPPKTAWVQNPVDQKVRFGL
jgi:hypothetical protein